MDGGINDAELLLLGLNKNPKSEGPPVLGISNISGSPLGLLVTMGPPRVGSEEGLCEGVYEELAISIVRTVLISFLEQAPLFASLSPQT
jgi:hypothetical protein